jgi:hypothetical protein
MYTVLCYSAQLFIKNCPTCFEPIYGSSSGAYLLKLHQHQQTYSEQEITDTEIKNHTHLAAL